MAAYRRTHEPSKGTIFILLMAVSAILLLMPKEFLRPVKQMTALTALPQMAVRASAEKLSEPMRQLTTSNESRDYNELLKQNQVLENQVLALQQSVINLKQTNAELAHIRRIGLPKEGSLLTARVSGLDAAPHRDSILINKGKMQKVDRQDWVASRLSMDAGKDDGVVDQAAVLAHECLIGWVEDASSTTSRVALLSDRFTNRSLRVHVAHRGENNELRWVATDNRTADFALQGIGGGQMKIADIPARIIEAGQLAVGDLVASDPQEPRLPLAMVIGEIVELQRNLNKPLYYDAIVRHRYDPKELNQVYVVNLSRRETSKKGS